MMPKAIRVHETGGPEVLRWEDYDPGKPSRGEIRIRHEAIGVNFIDTYHRAGLYPLSSFPFTPGLEGAGVVEETGEGVTDFRAGDRVAYGAGPLGAYAEVRNMPADRAVRLPDAIPSRIAAGMMLRGMTARYLLRSCYPIKRGDLVLIHAAAGGVGTIVTQWAKHLGATVYGTVGTDEKARIAMENGCDEPINYEREDFVERMDELTNGRGVDVVYDGVGKATFEKSLDCLRPMGMMVSFGQASGKVEPFDLLDLKAKGSLFLTRPSLMDYVAKRNDLVEHARDLFDVVESGAVKVGIGQVYPLPEAGKAHIDLESRRTVGSTVLVP
jgi:NADPH2:quinone reductase